MTGNVVLIGTLLLLTGTALALWKRRRAFDRVNDYGIERFPSYWGKLGAKAKDGALGVTSITFLTVGLLVLANHYEDSWGWIVLIPAYVFGIALFLGIPITLQAYTRKRR